MVTPRGGPQLTDAGNAKGTAEDRKTRNLMDRASGIARSRICGSKFRDNFKARSLASKGLRFHPVFARSCLGQFRRVRGQRPCFSLYAYAYGSARAAFSFDGASAANFDASEDSASEACA